MTQPQTATTRLFAARTQRVQSVRRIEALVDLDFAVQIRRTFLLDALQLPPLDEAMIARAKHCLVVLIGGKQLLVRPDPNTRWNWHLMPEILARVFLNERVFGRPVGYIELMPEAQGPVLEVAPYMNWLASQRFDVDLVRETLNWRPSQDGADGDPAFA